MKRFIFSAAIAVSLVTSAQYADPYKVIVPGLTDLNGAKATMINYDTGEAVDSVVVADATAVFTGTVDDPFAARVMVGGQRLPVFVLESGTIAFDLKRNIVFGSPLNDQLNELADSINFLAERIQMAPTDQEQEALSEQLTSFVDRQMRQNSDNPIGYLLFVSDVAYEMEPAELIAFVGENPALGKYARVQKLIENNRKKAATSVGAKYLDFDIDGKKLSDYVGRDGKYLLVDFFASWCGPCMRQLPVLKELYADYGDKLNVLGVAVWDEPDASLRAIKQHQLPWECIINAQTIPTDLYGISGIPCIMLISPDGTILSRDLQGDELKAAVADALK